MGVDDKGIVQGAIRVQVLEHELIGSAIYPI